LQSVPGYIESCGIREKIKDKSEKDFFKTIQTAYPAETEVLNTSVDSLKLMDEPVGVNYDLRIKNDTSEDIIYFNPMLAEGYKENPFHAADRKYPVEMHSAFDNVYIFNMEIPAGYVIEELPKSARVALNGTDGMFEYLVASQGNTIQLRARVRMDRAYFPPEDYPGLRDFFAYIVKKESEQIVLKKKP